MAKKMIPGARLRLHSYHNAVNIKRIDRSMEYSPGDGTKAFNFFVDGDNIMSGLGGTTFEYQGVQNQPFDPKNLVIKAGNSAHYCIFELTDLRRTNPATWPQPPVGSISVIGYSNNGFGKSSERREAGETELKWRIDRRSTTWDDVKGNWDFEVELAPLAKPGMSFAQPSVTISNASLEKLLAERIVKAQGKMGTLTWISDPSDPLLEQGNGASYYSQKSGHKVELKGSLVVSEDVDLQLLYDVDTGIVTYLDSLADPVNTTAEGEAARAIRERNDALKTFILNKAEGRATTPPPADRPAATSSPELNADVKKNADDWFKNYTDARAKAIAATGPTSQSAYDNYVAGGGTQSKADWEAAAASRVAAAKGDPESPDWLKTAGSALGWVGDKATSALSWLGNAGLDLLKSWGPTGTVGAYAGVKAVNAAGNGDMSKLLLYGGLALGAVMILK